MIRLVAACVALSMAGVGVGASGLWPLLGWPVWSYTQIDEELTPEEEPPRELLMFWATCGPDGVGSCLFMRPRDGPRSRPFLRPCRKSGEIQASRWAIVGRYDPNHGAGYRDSGRLGRNAPAARARSSAP